ncbi:hypothetical protein Tco_0224187, partial [Tanacetum coccineum]
PSSLNLPPHVPTSLPLPSAPLPPLPASLFIPPLGEIRALQAREQARADALEGTGYSTVVGPNNMPPKRTARTARVAAATTTTAATATPMTTAAIE